MLDQKNRHMELISYEMNGIHQFLSLIGVHACCRFIQQKELRIRSQCPGNLQLSLFSVRKVGGLEITFSVKSEYL